MSMEELKTKKGETLQIISKGKFLSTFKKIIESLEAKTFIEMALEDNDVLILLCSYHPTLSAFEQFNFPLLFSINRGKKMKSVLPFDLIATKETTKAQHTIERIVDRAKPTFEGLVEKFTGKYGKLLEDINVKSDSIVLQEEREQEILSMIVSQIIIQDVGNEEKIMKTIRMFEDFVIDDLVPVGLMFVDSLKKEIIDFGMKNRKKTISASSLDENEYEKTVDKLEIKYKVIRPLLSIFWCENEKHDHYSFYMLSHSIVPKLKCPICNRNLSVGTFYYFIPQVNYLLRSREGLIQALTIYKIDKTGRKWLPNVYLKGVKDDTEKDIVIEIGDGKYSIIEIKSFTTDVSPRTKKENIKKLMNQALEDLHVYNKQGILVESAYLISNYFVNDEIEQIVDDLLSKRKFEKLNKIDLVIVGPNNIQDLDELEFEEDE